MRRILLAVIAVLVLGATSCKKEAEVAPSKSTVKVSDKGDLGAWD